MFKILGTDGKEYGPVTQGNVIEWIRDGRANLQTKARKGDETEWKTLADFPEFVPTGTTPAFVPTSLPTPDVAPVASTSTTHSEALPLAGLGRRLLAAMVDGLLYFLCLLPAIITASGIISGHLANGEAPSFEMMLKTNAEALPKALPYLLILAVVQTALLCRRSQSVGKICLGIRIVTVRDETPGGPLRAYLLRGLLTLSIEMLLPLVFLQMGSFLVLLAPFSGKVFWLVDSFYIFREDQRCLHDLIAGTKVVKLK